MTYTLAEIRNGTGWPKGVRFAVVEPDTDTDDHGPGCDGPYNCTCPTQGVNGYVYYTMPVQVEIRDGEIWSVTVCDTSIVLDQTSTRDFAVAMDQLADIPELLRIAENDKWPSWEIG